MDDKPEERESRRFISANVTLACAAEEEKRSHLCGDKLCSGLASNSKSAEAAAA